MKNAERAAVALGRLNEIGAINLDVLLGQAEKVTGALGGLDLDDDDHGICYPNYIHIGPHYGDIVSVASQLKELGYTISRE